MPALTYSYSDFTAYTKIKSTEVNAKFSDIRTLLNTTKLDTDNVQLNGLNRNRLALGTANHVVINGADGNLSSEATLAKSRGGTGVDISSTALTLGKELILPEQATPSTPASGTGAIYFKTDGKLYQLNDGGTETQVGAGGAGGSKNYLTTYKASAGGGSPNPGNGDLELGTTSGFSLGTVTLTSALPTGTPTFGSGASGNLSISAVSSGQLGGSYSLSYASSAASTAGNFVASDAFYIDLEDQAKPLAFKFFYKAVTNPSNGNFSGTSSNSFGVAIYDVTNSAWIIPAGVFNLVQSSGVGIATGTFQTSSNGTQYRLVIFNANASAGAITMYFDDFYLGPQMTVAGVPMSDAQAYTPTFNGLGTPSSVSFMWQRVGDLAHIYGTMVLGTVTANEARIGLPSGLTTSDTSKIASTQIVGVATRSTATGNFYDVLAQPSVTYLNLSSQNTTGGSTGLVNGNTLFGNSETVTINAWVPISGWSSNTVMSADTDTRVVAMSATTTTVTTSGTSTPLVFNTSLFDTHAAYSTSTGRYTVTVSGVYDVQAYIYQTNHPGALSIYKNGTLYSKIGEAVTSSTDFIAPVSGSGKVQAVAGDIIDVRLDLTLTGAGPGTLSISRLSGPATVAASESVNCRYSSTAGQSISNNSTSQTVVYGTKGYDTHNAYNSSTGIYTVPVSGKYSIKGAVRYQTFNASANVLIRVYKNSTLVATSGVIGFSGSSNLYAAFVSDDESCNAGDTLEIRTLQDSGSSRSLTTTADENYIAISRIGN